MLNLINYSIFHLYICSSVYTIRIFQMNVFGLWTIATDGFQLPINDIKICCVADVAESKMMNLLSIMNILNTNQMYSLALNGAVKQFIVRTLSKKLNVYLVDRHVNCKFIVKLPACTHIRKRRH